MVGLIGRFFQYLFNLGYTSAEARDILQRAVFVGISIGFIALLFMANNFYNNRQTRRKLKIDTERNRRKLTGENIRDEFDNMRNELIRLIGDSQLLDPMGQMIDRLVDYHLPHLLAKRQNVLESKHYHRGDRHAVYELNQQLIEVNGLLSQNRRLFTRLKFVITNVKFSLHGGDQQLRAAMNELSEFAEVIQESVDTVIKDDDPLASANKELKNQLQHVQAICQPASNEDWSQLPKNRPLSSKKSCL